MANELAYFVPLPGYTHQKTEGKEGTESLVFPSNGRIELPRNFLFLFFATFVLLPYHKTGSKIAEI